MTIFDFSIIYILGIINFFLLLMQILSGYRILKLKFGVHKAIGTVLFITGSLHGILAIYFKYY